MPDSHDRAARDVAGRYRLTQELGRGGMGVVWRAYDVVLGRDVALKRILPRDRAGEDDRDQAARRILREARAAARLRHPAVVRVYDVVEDSDGPWIVMELLPGRSLEDEIRDRDPLPEGETARIGLRLLGALRAAHAAGVIHRDVKPANVLFGGEDGEIVLTDFGIALPHGEPAITASGVLVGSPAYMAPERLNGEPATAAADLWSLGATLYAAVEGAPPYRRPEPAAVLAAVLTRDPDPFHRAHLLRPVIQGLLRKNPPDRLPADRVAALLTDVAAAAEGAGDRMAGHSAQRPGVRPIRPIVPIEPVGLPSERAAGESPKVFGVPAEGAGPTGMPGSPGLAGGLGSPVSGEMPDASAALASMRTASGGAAARTRGRAVMRVLGPASASVAVVMGVCLALLPIGPPTLVLLGVYFAALVGVAPALAGVLGPLAAWRRRALLVGAVMPLAGMVCLPLLALLGALHLLGPPLQIAIAGTGAWFVLVGLLTWRHSRIAASCLLMTGVFDLLSIGAIVITAVTGSGSPAFAAVQTWLAPVSWFAFAVWAAWVAYRLLRAGRV